MSIKLINIKTQENDKIKNINKFRAFNYGFALLKTYLAFLIEMGHNFNINSSKNKIILKIANHRIPHVSSFFIISFYFTYTNLLSSKLKIFLKRLERLLIPYFIWPIIIWIINHIFNIETYSKFTNTFESLKLQLLYGHIYMTQFWFLWDLIIVTIIFSIIVNRCHMG